MLTYLLLMGLGAPNASVSLEQLAAKQEVAGYSVVALSLGKNKMSDESSKEGEDESMETMPHPTQLKLAGSSYGDEQKPEEESDEKEGEVAKMHRVAEMTATSADPVITQTEEEKKKAEEEAHSAESVAPAMKK